MEGGTHRQGYRSLSPFLQSQLRCPFHRFSMPGDGYLVGGVFIGRRHNLALGSFLADGLNTGNIKPNYRCHRSGSDMDEKTDTTTAARPTDEAGSRDDEEFESLPTRHQQPMRSPLSLFG